MADIGTAINLTLYSHIAFHFNYIVSLWFIIFPLEVKKKIYIIRTYWEIKWAENIS